MSHAGRIVVTQLILGIACVAAFFAVEFMQARSAMLALMTSVLPSGYYAWVLQRTHSATRLLLHGVIRALATLTFMAVCIVVFTVEPLGFFVTLAVLQLGYLAPKQARRAP